MTPSGLGDKLVLVMGLVALFTARESAVIALSLGALGGALVAEHYAKGRPSRGAVAMLVSIVVLATGQAKYDLMSLVAGIHLVLYWQDTGTRVLMVGGTLMLVAGGVPPGPFYAVMAAGATLGVGLRSAQVAADRIRARSTPGAASAGVTSWPGRPWLLQGALGLIVGSLAGSALPPLERWATDQMSQLTPVRLSGFSRATDLNSVSSLKSSPTLALRIVDGAPMLLRGQAYTTYRRGVWTTPRPPPPTTNSPPTRQTSARVVRIESELSDMPILFLPLGAHGVEAAPAEVFWDGAGVAAGRPVAPASWTFTPGVPLSIVTSGPAADELLAVPDELREPMARQATEWASTAVGDEAQIDAIARALGRHATYSTNFGKPGKEEPLARFLWKTRAGHCEYFASALTLLARAHGHRARYVTGFSAMERNPFGGYIVARDSDAHAWTEVWCARTGWATWDPTPPDWRAAAGGSDSWTRTRQLLDYLVRLVTRARDAVKDWASALASRLTLPRIMAWLALVTVLVLAWRHRSRIMAHWQRVTKRRGITGSVTSPSPTMDLDVAEARLVEVLGVSGLRRRPSETVRELVDRWAEVDIAPGTLVAARDAAERIARARYRPEPLDLAAVTDALEIVARAVIPSQT